MRVINSSLLLALLGVVMEQQHGGVVDAFLPRAIMTSGKRTTSSVTTLNAGNDNDNNSNPLSTLLETTQKHVSKAFAAALVASALWAAPAAITPTNVPSPINSLAQAKEMASGSGSRVNKDPESLLRYGLPINNKEVSSVS